MKQLSSAYTDPAKSKEALQYLLVNSNDVELQYWEEAGYIFDKYGNHELMAVPEQFNFSLGHIEKLAEALKPEFEVVQRAVVGPPEILLQLNAIPTAVEYRNSAEVIAQLVPYRSFRHIELPDDIGYN